jgi:hypothetical protein
MANERNCAVTFRDDEGVEHIARSFTASDDGSTLLVALDVNLG